MTSESCNLLYVVIQSTCGFVTEFEFIDNTSVNCNISNLNAKNTFELVEKEKSKYFLFKYLNEHYEKHFQDKFEPTFHSKPQVNS